MPVAQLLHPTPCYELMGQVSATTKESISKAIPLMSFEKAQSEKLILKPAEYLFEDVLGSDFAIKQYYNLAEAVAKSAYPDDVAVNLGSGLYIKYSYRHKSYIVVHNRVLVTFQNEQNDLTEGAISYTLDKISTDEGFLRLSGLKQGPYLSDFRLLPGVPLSDFARFTPSVLETKFAKHRREFAERKFIDSTEYEQAAVDLAESQSTDTLMIVKKLKFPKRSSIIVKFNYKTMERVVIYYDKFNLTYRLLTYFTMRTGNQFSAIFYHGAFVDDELYTNLENK